MELEHAIGFNGKASHSLHVHPTDDTILYALGGCIVIAQLKDTHNQVFLRGHDDLVTCVDVSPSGQLVASGQLGDNADVIIWEYHAPEQEGQLAEAVEKYRLQEHDIGIHSVHFTSDERFLLTVGKDKKLIVWDMLSGCIVSRSPKLKNIPHCACWGGRARDIKGRETTKFQFATGGDGSLTYWTLDPSDGSMTPEECTLGNQVHARTRAGTRSRTTTT